jgi:hypothetical protein
MWSPILSKRESLQLRGGAILRYGFPIKKLESIATDAASDILDSIGMTALIFLFASTRTQLIASGVYATEDDGEQATKVFFVPPEYQQHELVITVDAVFELWSRPLLSVSRIVNELSLQKHRHFVEEPQQSTRIVR